MMNIGIYGGTFDPVHNGHVKLARFMLEKLTLDKLIVIPAYRTPAKQENAACAADRVNMCRLAFSDPEIEVSDMDIMRGGKTYTVDTVNELKKIYGESNYYFITGSDQLFNFSRWYRFDEILSMVTLCTVSRRGSDRTEELEGVADRELRAFGRVLVFDFEPVEISSAAVRDILKTGGSVSGLIPEEAERYIIDRGLYK